MLTFWSSSSHSLCLLFMDLRIGLDWTNFFVFCFALYSVLFVTKQQQSIMIQFDIFLKTSNKQEWEKRNLVLLSIVPALHESGLDLSAILVSGVVIIQAISELLELYRASLLAGLDSIRRKYKEHGQWE